MDSDEEKELQEMRGSARYVPSQIRRAQQAKPSDSAGVDREEADYWVGQNKPSVGPQKPPSIEDTGEGDFASAERRRALQNLQAENDEEDAPTVVGLEALAAAGLPTDFGHKAVAKDVTAALRAVRKHLRQHEEVGEDAPSVTLTKKELIEASTAEFRQISEATSKSGPGDSSSEPIAASSVDADMMEDDDPMDQVLPVSHELQLRSHEKPISAMAMDPSGARLATGSHDYTVKLWDFGGMDMRLKNFRSIEPLGGHVVNSLSFSVSGDCFVCATASQQPKIFDRDAKELLTFEKGDQYLSDMNHTKGHVGIVTNAVWHPADKGMIMTASLDGTVRLLDPMDVTRNRAVIKAKIRTPRQRAAITASCFDSQGAKIAAYISVEGSIQVWPTKGPYHRPSVMIENAHFAGSETSCLRFLNDGYTLLSRGMDDSMKLWDLRKPKSAVHVWGDLRNSFAHTECAVSPDEQFIATGTSGARADPTGTLAFFRRDTFEAVKEIEYADASVIRVLWHPKLNQIILGLSDSSGRVLFDPSQSQRGALLCVARSMPKADIYKQEFQGDVLNPHALPMYRRQPSKKKLFAKMRKDPKATKMPDIVRTGPGVGGRLGSCHTAHLLQTLGYANNPLPDVDPREALLKYADRAQEKSFFFKAYDETQPKTIFAEPEESGQPAEEQPPAAKRPRN